MARTDPQINIRVPEQLKKDIEIASIENGRSINTEVVFRLVESFESTKDNLENIPTEKLMKELASRLDGFQISANDGLVNAK